MKRIISCFLSVCMFLSVAIVPVCAMPEGTTVPEQSDLGAVSEPIPEQMTVSEPESSQDATPGDIAEPAPTSEQSNQTATEGIIIPEVSGAVSSNGAEISMLGDSMGLIGLKWYGAKVANVRLNNGYNTGFSNNAAVWINSACQTLYCMEPAAPTSGGTQYVNTRDVLLNSPYVCKNITSSGMKEELIGVILQYGCIQVNNPVTDEQALHYLATQVLIHEVILEERNANFDYIGVAPGCTPVKNSYQFTDPTYSNRFNEIYNDIVNHVKTYYNIPSFAKSNPDIAPTIILDKYDYNSGEYYTDVHSDVGAVSEFFPAGQYGDYTLTPWGNDDWLRIATRVNNPAEQTITDNRNDPIPGLVFWGASGKQSLGQVSGEVPDPVGAYFKTKVGYMDGNLSLDKTAEVFHPDSNSYSNEDGVGFTFELLQNGQLIETNTTTANHTEGEHFVGGGSVANGGTITGSDGIQISVSPISGDSFTVTVTGLPSNSYNILIPVWTTENGQDDIVWYSANRDGNNTCQVTVPLSQHNNEAGGYNVHLYLSQMGNLTFDHLAPGEYTVREVNTPTEMLQPTDQTVFVVPTTDSANASQITQLDFENILKKGEVGYIKKCSYYENMRLRGAVYGVYDNNDVLIQSLTSDADYVYSSPLPYGDYYLKEITPPHYYAGDDTVYPFAITEDGQQICLTAWNAPYSDVYPEYIVPNSDYRQGTTVMVSYFIHNDSIADHTPDKPLTVHLIATVTKENGTTEQLPEQTLEVIVPRFSENLISFPVEIPEDATEISLKCVVDTPDGVIETNTENNRVVNDLSVDEKPCEDTPDTEFENTPPGFTTPDENTEPPIGEITDRAMDEASWQQWEYQEDEFVLTTYGVRLTTEGTVVPDADNPSAETTDEGFSIKSGYGVGVTQTSNIEQLDGELFPALVDYTLPQNGNVYWPEFEYQLEPDCYSTLEQTQDDSLELRGSPYTFLADGTQDYRRTHFTPLWFPDGDYTVKTYVYDCWTPAGMLSLQATLSPMDIQGDMYDDWYISHVARNDK